MMVVFTAVFAFMAVVLALDVMWGVSEHRRLGAQSRHSWLRTGAFGLLTIGQAGELLHQLNGGTVAPAMCAAFAGCLLLLYVCVDKLLQRVPRSKGDLPR